MKSVGLLSGVSLLAAALSFCGVCRAQEHLRVVPADAVMTIRANVGDIMEMADCEELAAKMLQVSGRAGGMGELFAESEKAGVDISEPVYIFAVDENEMGLAVKLSDAGRFGRTIAEAGMPEVRTDGGVSWIEDEGFCLAFDKNVAVAAVTGDGYGAKELCRMLREAKKGSRHGESALLRRMAKTEGEIAVVLSGSMIDACDMPAAVRSYYAGVPFDDMMFAGSVTTSGGETVIRWEAVPLTAEAERYIARNAEAVGPLKGVFADFIPSSSILASCSAVHGDKIVGILEETGLMKELKAENASEVKRLVGSLAGDVALMLGVPRVDGGDIDLPAALMAEVKDRAIMEFAADLLRGSEDVKTEEIDGGYRIDNGGVEIIMVERDGRMVISTMPETSALREAEEPLRMDGSRGSYGCFYLDVAGMMSAVGPFAGLLDSEGRVMPLISRISSVEGVARSPQLSETVIRMKEKDDNIYRVIAAGLASLAAEGDGGGDEEAAFGGGQEENGAEAE